MLSSSYSWTTPCIPCSLANLHACSYACAGHTSSESISSAQLQQQERQEQQHSQLWGRVVYTPAIGFVYWQCHSPTSCLHGHTTAVTLSWHLCLARQQYLLRSSCHSSYPANSILSRLLHTWTAMLWLLIVLTVGCHVAWSACRALWTSTTSARNGSTCTVSWQLHLRNSRCSNKVLCVAATSKALEQPGLFAPKTASTSAAVVDAGGVRPDFMAVLLLQARCAASRTCTCGPSCARAWARLTGAWRATAGASCSHMHSIAFS